MNYEPGLESSESIQSSTSDVIDLSTAIEYSLNLVNLRRLKRILNLLFFSIMTSL